MGMVLSNTESHVLLLTPIAFETGIATCCRDSLKCNRQGGIHGKMLEAGALIKANKGPNRLDAAENRNQAKTNCDKNMHAVASVTDLTGNPWKKGLRQAEKSRVNRTMD